MKLGVSSAMVTSARGYPNFAATNQQNLYWCWSTTYVFVGKMFACFVGQTLS